MKIETIVSEIASKIQSSLSFLKEVFEVTGDPIFVKDEALRFVLVNEAFCTLLGIKREDIIGKTLADSLPADQMEHFSRVDRRILETGVRNRCEELLTVTSGEVKTVVTKKTRYVDEQGNRYIVGVIHDITERKQAENNLVIMDEKFKKLISHAPGMIYQFMRKPDGSYCVPFTSFGIVDIYGVSPEDVRDDFSPIIRTILPADLDALMYSINGSAEKLSTWNFEYRVQLPGQSIKWIYAHSVPEKYPDGSIVWHGFCEDITERKQNEIDLALKTKLESDFINSLPHIAMIIDEDKVIRVSNELAKQSGAFVGTYCWKDFAKTDFLCPRDKEKFVLGQTDGIQCTHCLANQAIHEEKECKHEILAWGRILDVTWKYIGKDDNGKALYLHYAIDITEQKQREETLILEKVLLKAYADTSPDGKLVVSNSGEIIRHNELFLKMWKVPTELWQSKDDTPVLSFVVNSVKDPEKFLKKVLYLYSHVDECSTDEIELLDGRFFERYSAPLIDENGKNHGRMWNFRDVSERKQKEVELHRAKELAEAANLTKSQFMNVMSHELRTPLNGIYGGGQLLLEENLTAKQRGYALMVVRSADILLVLINGILDMAKIEAGKLEVNQRKFDLHEVISEVMDMMESEVRNKGLALNLEYSMEMPTGKYIGDDVRIRQIVTNLVGNALKFTSIGGVTLKVRSGLSKDEVFQCQIEVKDTGIGIPPDKIGELFKKFSQLDPSITRKYGGTGLGLYISKYMANMMGGDITVASVEKEGSTFTFNIPLRVSNDVSQNIPTQIEVMPCLDYPARVLVVEDDTTSQLLIVAFLKSLGCLVDLAQNGEEAVSMYGNGYDIIFMDYMMPKMNGCEASTAIRVIEKTNGKHVPIVAVTAKAFQEEKDECYKAGMDDLIEKPVKKIKLAKALVFWTKKAK